MPPPTAAALPERLAGFWAASRRYRWPALGVLALAALAAGFGPRILHGREVALVTVVQRDFVQSVVASGRVEAPHRVTIGTQIVGTARRVPVAEGQAVQAGQVLIELENAELRAAVAQADVAVHQAEARLRQLREVQAPVADAALGQAQVTLEAARKQWRRSSDLYSQGFVGQAALDDAKKAVDLAQAQLRVALSQYQSAQPRGSDVAIAMAVLEQARASADLAASRLAYATIKAAVPGTLIARDVEPGDVVQPGKALMVLSPAGPSELVVQIDEKNLHLLSLGLTAQASADAYADQRFAAQVAYINPGVDAQRGSVEVKLRIVQAPDFLKQDMTVSVDIAVARRTAAVLVPLDAVHDVGSAQPWVLKRLHGRAVRQAVTLGLRSGGVAEVLEGLRAGDSVVPLAAAEVREGSRVRPARAASASGSPSAASAPPAP